MASTMSVLDRSSPIDYVLIVADIYNEVSKALNRCKHSVRL